MRNHSEKAPQAGFGTIKEELNAGSKKFNSKIFYYFAASWLLVASFGLGYFTKSMNDTKSEMNALNENTKTVKTEQIASIDKNQNSPIKKEHFANNELLKKKKKVQFSNKINNSKTVHASSIIATNNFTNIQGIQQTVDTNATVLTKTDSLKLIYKYISLSTGESLKDTSHINVTLAYETPVFPIESSKSANWSIAAGVAPMMGFDMFGLEQEQAPSRLKTDAQPVQNSNAMHVSYSSGLSIKRSISEKWNMRTGMSYNKIVESNNDISYVELPIISEYRIINKLVRVYFTNGVGAGFKQADLYPMGLTGFSILYPLSKSIDMNFEPSYKHMFGKSWNYKADYYGMMAGFSVKF